jgi:hypothetical protein
MRAKPLDVAACLESPQRAIALLNTVIASGGDLDAIEQAVGVVTAALKLDFNRDQPPDDTPCPHRPHSR